jgi:hypothetical protein
MASIEGWGVANINSASWVIRPGAAWTTAPNTTGRLQAVVISKITDTNKGKANFFTHPPRSLPIKSMYHQLPKAIMLRLYENGMKSM